MNSCPLCTEDGGLVIHRDALLRVVQVEDPDLPGFVRVILNTHVKEISDLDAATRARLLDAVVRVESVLREVLDPLKMNVASLGNVVPHVHWHLIPRFADDAFFPRSIWDSRQRETAPEVLAARRSLLPKLRERLAHVLATL